MAPSPSIVNTLKRYHDMSIGRSVAAYELYPRDYFHKAPTYKKWIKLTAADIALLRQEPDFEGQNIYFHLNHPIEFVYLIGTVVAIDHVTTKYGTYFTTFELDDGSGSVIDVKIGYKGRGVKKQGQDSQGTSKGDNIAADGSEESGEDFELGDDTDADVPASLRTEDFETDVPDLLVTSSPRHGWKMMLQDDAIEVGTVLRVKATLSRFREAFQLVLKRAFLARVIDEELAFWEDYSHFCTAALSKPWILTEREIAAMKEEQREKRRHEKRIEQKKRQYEVKKQEKTAEVRERERNIDKVREAQAREMDGNALDKPNWKPHKPMNLANMGNNNNGPLSIAGSLGLEHQQQQARHVQMSSVAIALVPQARDTDHNVKQRSTEQHDKDGFRIPAMPLNRGFVRTSSLLNPDHDSIPWHHAKPMSKPVGQLTVAGPSLGPYRTSKLVAAVAGEQNVVWKHERTHNPPYKKPLRRSNTGDADSIRDAT